jgi:TRAP-type mannitol/chloroaromatic compound transport system permease large subunit
MLASFFIVYIIITTRLDPSKAPLPEPEPGDPESSEKRLMFLGFVSRLSMWISGVLFARAMFFTVLEQNTVTEGVDPIFLGMVSDIPYIVGAFILALIIIRFVVGIERTNVGWEMGKGLIAPTVVIGVVLGSIYGGITGITEAAGMGVIAVFVIGLIRREMTMEIVWDAVMRTLKSTGTIIWVTIGAAALAAAYTLVGGPTYVANLIVGTELPAMGIILVMMVIFLIMGMFMDWVGIVLLVMPVFLPIVMKLPVEDLGFIGELEPRQVAVWFGVLFCMNMQVSFLSPPFGPAAFYLKSVAPDNISLTDIFRGFLPFICLQLLALAVLLIWPGIITLFLP